MKGKCHICNGIYTKVGMERHLKKHLKDDGDSKLYQIRVDAIYHPEYWLYIEIPADANLKEIDKFLRDIWLECCDHLSAFKIGDIEYHSLPNALPDAKRGMCYRLYRLLSVGMEFYYIYDFGDSTELRLKVVGERMGKKGKENIRILARNEPPEIRCACGEKAKWVCTFCLYCGNYSKNAWLCDECANKHQSGEHILLPVVNSPRCGVCGYKGGKYD